MWFFFSEIKIPSRWNFAVDIVDVVDVDILCSY